MTNENARLSKDITKLKQQMALLLQNKQKQPPHQQNGSKLQHPAPTMHSTTTNNNNILTTEFIALVAQAVQNIQPSTSECNVQPQVLQIILSMELKWNRAMTQPQ